MTFFGVQGKLHPHLANYSATSFLRDMANLTYDLGNEHMDRWHSDDINTTPLKETGIAFNTVSS